QERRARIELGVIGRDDLRESQVELWRSADAGDRWLLRRLGPNQRLAHEGIKSLLDTAAEDPVRLARGILELDDVHLVAETLAEQLDRIDRRAVPMRRVDP